MTVPVGVARIQYFGTGSAGPFAFNFVLYDQTHLKITRTSLLGVDTVLALTTDYTVAIASDNTSATVTLIVPLAGTGLAGSSEKLTIVEDPPISQLVEWSRNDPFPFQTHQRAADLAVLLIGRLSERVNRAPLLAESSSFSGIILPDPVASAALGWNAAGTNLENKALAALGVIGLPTSSVDNSLVRFDGTTGKVLQGSLIIVDDGGNVSGAIGITSAKYNITGAAGDIVAGPAVPAAGSTQAIDWIWGATAARTTLINEGSIWAAKVFSGFGFAKSFTSANDSAAPGLGPNVGLYVYAGQDGTNNDVVAVLGTAKASVANKTAFGANFIARNDIVNGDKLVGCELDVEFAATTTAAAASGGLFINIFNAVNAGPALLIGGLGGGTFQNGLVIGGLATSGSALAPNGAAAMDSLFNSGSGTFTTAVGILSNTHRIRFNGTAGAHAAIFNDNANNLRIVGGSAGIALRNNGDTVNNMLMDNTGNATFLGSLRSASSTGGIGYSGGGGSVTQLTNKSTAVTANFSSAKITMEATTAIASSATVIFTVNNTAYDASKGDTIDAHHASGGTAAAYRIDVCSVGTNSFALAVTNRTGGSLSEALVINFNIIKGGN